MKDEYIKFQKALRTTLDFVFSLHGNRTQEDLDKDSKSIACSTSINLVDQFLKYISLGILQSEYDNKYEFKTIKQIEELAYNNSKQKEKCRNYYIYESTLHLALTYMSLNDLVQKSKRNISIWQNWERYYLQYSGKEDYCNMPNLYGSPTCKTYASRKAYDSKTEGGAELTYKRKYQRRITKVYCEDKTKKE